MGTSSRGTGVEDGRPDISLGLSSLVEFRLILFTSTFLLEVGVVPSPFEGENFATAGNSGVNFEVLGGSEGD